MLTYRPRSQQRTRGNAWRVVGVSVVGVALLVAAMALQGKTPAASDCTFSIDDAIPIGPEQATVLAKFSSTIGDTMTVTFPDEANVVVLSAQRGKSDAPRTATFVLMTLRATGGQWMATARGGKGVCTGQIWIGSGKPKKKG